MDKWLRNNNFVKVLALAIGVLLWVVVHLDLETGNTTVSSALRNTSISNVMVQPIYDESQYSVVSIEPREVTVELKGNEAAIRRINPNNLKIVVDLSKQGEGTFQLPVKADDQLPAGVSAVITPTTVRVVVEEKQTKEVPVDIQVKGKPAEGYQAGKPVVNPTRVYVTVPSSLKDRVESARGEINIDQSTSPVTKKVRLTAYDKNGNEVKGSISPPVVDVTVPVTLPFKTMPLQIKWVGQPSRGYAISAVQQSVEQITVYGKPSVLDTIEYYDGVTVDVTGLKDDQVYKLPIPVKDKSLQVEPAEVEIKVTVVPSVTRVFDQVPLTFSGLAEGLQTQVITPPNGKITVTLEGAPNAMDKLRTSDIQAVVQMGNVAVGQHDANVKLSLPPFIEWVDPPMRVTLNVTQSSGSANGTAKQSAETSPSSSAAPASGNAGGSQDGTSKGDNASSGTTLDGNGAGGSGSGETKPVNGTRASEGPTP